MPRGGNLKIDVSKTRLDADYAQMFPEIRTGRYVLIAVIGLKDVGRGASARFRTVLHDEADWRRNRSRSQHGLWFRQAIAREHSNLPRVRTGQERKDLLAFS